MESGQPKGARKKKIKPNRNKRATKTSNIGGGKPKNKTGPVCIATQRLHPPTKATTPTNPTATNATVPKVSVII